jgi:hypothetical protein
MSLSKLDNIIEYLHTYFLNNIIDYKHASLELTRAKVLLASIYMQHRKSDQFDWPKYINQIKKFEELNLKLNNNIHDPLSGDEMDEEIDMMTGEEWGMYVKLEFLEENQTKCFIPEKSPTYDNDNMTLLPILNKFDEKRNRYYSGVTIDELE